MHLVMWDRFWARDKDGGHTIRFTIAENPMLHTNIMDLSYRT